jgi:hypothetical protein
VIDFPRLLAALHNAGVRFIVVGGAAATAHGSVRLTLDLDVVYERSATTAGAIDLLGEITGGGGWSQLMPHTIEMPLFGYPTHVLDLDRLIHVKRAAGRTKDIEAIAELEALREERDE